MKCVLFQCALGLSYIHSRGIVHRDIKPENILINKQTAEIKIIDFGLAVEQSITATDYVATRWYRAPENLLGTKEYTTKIDVFSLACVAVELYLGAPLFPGADNLDQLYKIFNVLGEPNDNTWPNGAKKFRDLGFRSSIPSIEPTLSLSQLLKTSSHSFISLI